MTVLCETCFPEWGAYPVTTRFYGMVCKGCGTQEKVHSFQGDPRKRDDAEAELCRLIAEYYETNASGGALHIALDDGNLYDSHIWWCVKESIPEEKDTEALFLAYALLSLPEDDRFRLYEDRWWRMQP